MFKKIKSYTFVFKQIIKNYNKALALQQDIGSANNIQSLIDKFKNYIPFNQMSLRPYGLEFILNEIVINQRKEIIEFGSGISTLLTAKLIQTNNLESHIVSIDQDGNWQAILYNIAKEEGIEKYITFYSAPLNNYENRVFWYDCAVLPCEIKTHQYDMIIIDGPTSGALTNNISRYLAVKYLENSLHENCFLLLNDAKRDGEMEVLKKWEEEFGLVFNSYHHIAWCYLGNHYISNPDRYNFKLY